MIVPYRSRLRLPLMLASARKFKFLRNFGHGELSVKFQLEVAAVEVSSPLLEIPIRNPKTKLRILKVSNVTTRSE